MFKKLIAILLVIAQSSLSLGTTAFAASHDAVISGDIYCYDVQLSEADNDFINKVVSVSEYWYFDENNNLALNLTENQLKTTYEFSDEQYNRLTSEIIGYSLPDVSSEPAPAFVEDGTLYITYDDLTVGMFAAVAAAATVGPAALEAALVALASALGGPVGTILSLILTVIAAPSLVELAGRIIYAVATQQGIYIRPVLSYPPLEIGYW